NAFECQHQARGFTARGDFGKRFERLAGIRSDKELHAINSAQVTGEMLFRLAMQADRDTLLISYLLNLHAETRTTHVEIVELFFHGAREAQRGLLAALG